MFKVSDIDAEYFPPKEDIILQNEAPTDLYILVSGAVVCKLYSIYKLKCKEMELKKVPSNIVFYCYRTLHLMLMVMIKFKGKQLLEIRLERLEFYAIDHNLLR